MSAGGLPVLTYHAFDASRSVVATDPRAFAESLIALSEAGYRTVDLTEWVAAGRPAVDRGFALTIDDGYRSILDIAHVVAQLRFTATIFAVTDRVGTDNAWPGQPATIPGAKLLSWSELDALHAFGFRVGAHGRTHDRLNGRSERELEHELLGSRDTIEERLGRPCDLLAYPYGAADRRTRDVAARYFGASFGTRLDLTRPSQDVHSLSRVDAFYLRSPRVVERLIAGRLDGWLRVRRALRTARRAGALWRVPGVVALNVPPSRRTGAEDLGSATETTSSVSIAA